MVRNRRLFQRQRTMLAVSVGAILALLVWVNSHSIPPTALVALAGAAVSYMTSPWHGRWHIRRCVERFLRNDSSGTELGPHTLAVEPNGLAESTESSEAHFDWTAVQEVAATESHAFVYVGNNKAIIVPRQHFTPEFERELRKYLGPEVFRGTVKRPSKTGGK